MLSFFDAPIEFCGPTAKFVRLDQVQRTCARKEQCPPGRSCPLEQLFKRPACHRASHRRRGGLGWE